MKFKLLLTIGLIFFSTVSISNEVILIKDEEMVSLKKSAIEGMLEYMNESEVSYTSDHVNTCSEILDFFLASIQGAASEKEALVSVENAVVSLNKLNETTNYELIETSQREDLALYIIRATHLLGFNEDSEDVTEEWRDW